MNESTIKMFLTIAEEKSFSKAADRMFASQPNLSRSIIKMEEELGVQLFDRVGRKAELTEAGREFYDFFRRTQLEFQKVSAYARKLHSNRPGNIRIGYMEGWKISGFIDNVLNKLKENQLDVPGQISITGLDDIEMASMTVPGLTTIRQPARSTGEAAMNLLIDCIEDNRMKPQKIVIEPELVIRSSVKRRI